ncbi:HAMP domain-containing protein, partial [Acinetobacter baumannii]
MSQTMRKLAGGDLDVAVESSERGDEVGNMAKSVLVFKENGLKARAAENDARKLREAADRERQQAEAHRAAVAQEQSE